MSTRTEVHLTRPAGQRVLHVTPDSKTVLSWDHRRRLGNYSSQDGRGRWKPYEGCEVSQTGGGMTWSLRSTYWIVDTEQHPAGVSLSWSLGVTNWVRDCGHVTDCSGVQTVAECECETPAGPGQSRPPQLTSGTGSGSDPLDSAATHRQQGLCRLG